MYTCQLIWATITWCKELNFDINWLELVSGDAMLQLVAAVNNCEYY